MAMELLYAIGHPFECEMDVCVFESRRFDPEIRSKHPTIDHVVPTSRGGTNSPHNLQFAHRRCNFGAITRGTKKPFKPLNEDHKAKIKAGLRKYWDIRMSDEDRRV